MMMWLIGAGSAVAGVIIGCLVCALRARSLKTSASSQAEKLLQEAKKEADQQLKEARFTARTEALKIKEETESELKDRRREQQTAERRIAQKEENLQKKEDAIDAKIANMEKKEQELEEAKNRHDAKTAELHQLYQKQVEELERVAGMDRETAKNLLLERLRGEVENESGKMIRDILDDARQRAEREAQTLMVQSIQRYAGDCTYERTTTTIPLPNDEMKGRIIGREGRNIRALEAATGVNILIDDTPEAVVISCFDPIRKETARRMLEKLIQDGRIHPTRIEDMVKKIRKELDDELYEYGERAVLDAAVQGVPKALLPMLGRLHFRFSFSQNVLKHSIETAAFMGTIAAELGLDEQKARRIGLFHDIGKAVDHEIEGTHAAIGADILKKYNESKDVVNAVAAHHNEVEGLTLYAILVNACDALSASRPGARSETTELYLRRLEQLEEIAGSFDGIESCFALQAGREIRVVVQPEKITEEKAQLLARDICTKIESEMNYPGQIKVTIIRETRSVEYAK